VKKILIMLALSSCTAAQGAGTISAVTSPECIACASQIIQGVAAQKAKGCAVDDGRGQDAGANSGR
jgi:hypothetical protein